MDKFEMLSPIDLSHTWTAYFNNIDKISDRANDAFLHYVELISTPLFRAAPGEKKESEAPGAQRKEQG